jgi:uncharacterized protein YjbJ (UPF0337 family)
MSGAIVPLILPPRVDVGFRQLANPKRLAIAPKVAVRPGGGTYAESGRWKGKSQEDYLMTDDRISGSAKNIGGQLEEGFGRVTGDEKMQLEGRARQAEGTLQDVYGQAKETAVDAAGAIRDRASEASDFLREMIEERPFTAAAIALGIGFLIGRFGRAD